MRVYGAHLCALRRIPRSPVEDLELGGARTTEQEWREGAAQGAEGEGDKRKGAK